MEQWDFLLLYIFVPLLGMVLVANVRGSNEDIKRNSRNTAMWAASVQLITVIIGILVFAAQDTTIIYDMAYSPWLPTFNVHYYLQLDSISINFIGVTTILVTMALYLGKFIDTNRNKLYYSLVLLLQTSMNVMLMAVDMMVFLASLEITVLTAFVLFGVASLKQHQNFIMGFLGLTQLAAALISFVFLAIYTETDITVFDGQQDLALSDTLQWFGGIAMTLSVLLYTPVWPLHGWFVSMMSRGRTGVSILILGTFPSVGLYIALRFLPMLFGDRMPVISLVLTPMLCVIVLMYVWLALSRRHAPRNVMVYLFMAQCLISLMAVLTNIPMVKVGALFMLLGNILAYGGLMTILLYIAKYGGQTALDAIGGLLGGQTPNLFFATTMMLAFVIYMPGSMNFLGLVIVLKGVFASEFTPEIIILLVTIILSLMVSLGVWVTFYRRLVFGRLMPIRNLSQSHKIPDVMGSDRLFLWSIGLFIIILQFAPWAFLESIISYLG